MTQGIYRFPQEHNFTPSNEGKLPPCNIEAEEAVLGAILLDPDAIYRIKDRLRPEHFYVGAHRDIYHACLKLVQSGEGTDLLSVTTWLENKKILTRVGGKNALGNIFYRTVSSVNVDHLAALLIDKAIRRELIKSCNEIIDSSYETERDIRSLFSVVKNRIQDIVEAPIAPTKDDHQQFKHDRLVEELTKIYTTCDVPSLRYLKLKDLADDNRLSLGFLELFYLKSLTAQCSKLLSLKELQELAGSTVREWLINGLVPKSSTILLVADGGVGKTKFIYGIGKTLIEGKQFGTFHPTGEKRKILYYQGDESPGDMWQALQALGYSEEDEDKYVKIRFGWSAENMPTLITDLNNFKPDLVVIDSLSTINRFSTHQESQMEYARPILEMTGLSIQHQCTFLIIHHTNRKGDARGTTAIRNSVSEVWELSKPVTQMSTPNDRILEINKSRSRSSGKKYRLYFNEDLSFTFLGEESEELGGPNSTAKDNLLAFLSENRNIRYTCQELSHFANVNDSSARRALAQLAGDGLISCHKTPGKANLYFLTYEGDRTGDHPAAHIYQKPEELVVLETQTANPSISKSEGGVRVITPDHPVITSSDHLQKDHTEGDTAKGDHLITENDDFKNLEPEKNSSQILEASDHLRPKSHPVKDSRGDHLGDHPLITPDHPMITSDYLEDKTPLIQEKQVYWSESNKRKITVNLILENAASCKIHGLPGSYTVEFNDIKCCEDSPVSDIQYGDLVLVMAGNKKDEFGVVTSLSGSRIFLKSEETNKSLRIEFYAHQLVKISEHEKRKPPTKPEGVVDDQLKLF